MWKLRGRDVPPRTDTLGVPKGRDEGLVGVPERRVCPSSNVCFVHVTPPQVLWTVTDTDRTHRGPEDPRGRAGGGGVTGQVSFLPVGSGVTW